jgi:hypothetical protein
MRSLLRRQRPTSLNVSGGRQPVLNRSSNSSFRRAVGAYGFRESLSWQQRSEQTSPGPHGLPRSTTLLVLSSSKIFQPSPPPDSGRPFQMTTMSGSMLRPVEQENDPFG